MKGAGGVFAVFTREFAWHLERAIAEHRRWARTNGLRVPEQMVALGEFLSHQVSGGHQRSPVDNAAALADPGAGQRSPLLDVGDVARALNVSESTVKRLLRSGEISSLQIGTARRVHRGDLDAYMSRLGRGTTNGSDHQAAERRRAA